MKGIILLLAACTTLFSACKDKKKEGGTTAVPPGNTVDSFLVTDSAWGPITASTTFDDLKKIYGEENLKDVRECDLECMDSIDVTKVYPGQPNEITITWFDSEYHKKISGIQCFGESPAWHSAEGIRIGSGLRDLVKANDTLVSFYGFGWDYGGTVSGFNGGKLENTKIGYRMDLYIQSDADHSLYGDVGLDTNMPAVKNVMDSIRISWMLMSFYKPAEE